MQNIQPEELEFKGSIFYALYVVPARAEQMNLSAS